MRMPNDLTITRAALRAAGWRDLRKHPQRGGTWLGTDPDGRKNQPAPMLLHDPLAVLEACLSYRPTIIFDDNGVHVHFDMSWALVAFADCDGRPLIALARALTMALARVGEQLELFEE